MASVFDAYGRLISYYQQFVEKRSTEFMVLDHELLQIEHILVWLSNHDDNYQPSVLLNLLENISPFFERRSLFSLLLKYIDVSLKAAARLKQNQGWIYLIAYRANWALGRWGESRKNILSALEITRPNSTDFAFTLKCLGSLELNRGNYKEALRIFSKAKQIYHDNGDTKGETEIQGEEAAYYLNKAEYIKAFQLYSEIMEFERDHETQISDHTLLMMGAVSRRLKNYTDAIDYLNQLLQRAKINHMSGAYATAAHHLSWTYIDLGQYKQAKVYGELAEKIYEEINDLRGVSDADEQLGLIAITMGEFVKSQMLLEQSINLRQELGNQQGYASSVHRMAKLRSAQRRPFAAIYYVAKSLYLYKKIGMLPLSRIIQFALDLFSKDLVS